MKSQNINEPTEYSKDSYLRAIYASDLNITCSSILSALAIVFADYETGKKCWPSDKQLAKAAKCSERIVRKWRPILREKGWITTSRSFKGYRYDLHQPELKAGLKPSIKNMLKSDQPELKAGPTGTQSRSNRNSKPPTITKDHNQEPNPNNQPPKRESQGSDFQDRFSNRPFPPLSLYGDEFEDQLNHAKTEQAFYDGEIECRKPSQPEQPTKEQIENAPSFKLIKLPPLPAPHGGRATQIQQRIIEYAKAINYRITDEQRAAILRIILTKQFLKLDKTNDEIVEAVKTSLDEKIMCAYGNRSLPYAFDLAYNKLKAPPVQFDAYGRPGGHHRGNQAHSSRKAHNSHDEKILAQWAELNRQDELNREVQS